VVTEPSGDADRAPGEATADELAPLPSFDEKLREIRTAGDEASFEGGYRVPSVDPAGDSRMWAHPRYWPKKLRPYWDPRSGYVGYWEDLDVKRPWWKRPTRALSIVGLVVLFFVPLAVGGFWWLPLLVSEFVVGTLLILGTPGGRMVPGTTHFRKRLIAPVVVALGVAGLLSLLVYNDLAFGTWSLSGPPPMIVACGGGYTVDGDAIPSPSGVVLHQVGVTPSGDAILGNAQCGSAGSVWAFVGVGHGRVIPYRINGYLGPQVPYSH
jgi:hypothetical protein